MKTITIDDDTIRDIDFLVDLAAAWVRANAANLPAHEIDPGFIEQTIEKVSGWLDQVWPNVRLPQT